MRQLTIVLATALITATITVCSMKAISSISPPRDTQTRASPSLDVMKMMRDANDLPNQSYPAH